MNSEIKRIQDSSWNLLTDHYNELLDTFRVWKVSNFRKEEFHEYLNEDDDLDLNGIYLEEDYVENPNDDSTIKSIEDTFGRIDIALESRNSKQIYRLLQKAEKYCESLNVKFSYALKDIKEEITLTKIENGSLLFLPPKPNIIVPQLILPVQLSLISLIKDNPKMIFQVSSREFEEIIAELFHARGFEVELTKQTRDGGRDIIAVFEHLNIRSKYLIECKRYSPDNKVTLSIVQRLFGIKIAESANKAILATTSSYTKPAQAFAANHIWDLDLKSYNDIIGWIKNYDYPGKISIS
jgi:hypothetical protein